MKGLKYLILIIGGVILLWKSGNYSEEYVTGEYLGIAIGDSKQSVASLLTERGIDNYSYITLEKGNNVQVEKIEKDRIGDWFESDVWTLTESNSGSYLKATRIIFDANRVSRIESWSKWLEVP